MQLDLLVFWACRPRPAGELREGLQCTFQRRMPRPAASIRTAKVDENTNRDSVKPKRDTGGAFLKLCNNLPSFFETNFWCVLGRGTAMSQALVSVRL